METKMKNIGKSWRYKPTRIASWDLNKSRNGKSNRKEHHIPKPGWSTLTRAGKQHITYIM